MNRKESKKATPQNPPPGAQSLHRTTISLPPDVMSKLKARAAADNRSVSGYVQQLVKREKAGQLAVPEAEEVVA